MSRHSRVLAAAALVALSSGLVLGSAGCVAGVRVYDPEYNQYHHWNRGEEVQFRVYLDGRHEPYRKFRSLNRDEQRDYWKWRHERGDEDRH